jgi:hypothetical protein
MPVLDFPNNPTSGDQWVGTNGALYQWDGSTWNLASVAPGMSAGGDLTGSYPDPIIKNGAMTPAKIAAGGDPNELLSINGAGNLTWIAPVVIPPDTWTDSNSYLSPTKSPTYPVHTGYLSVAGKLDVLDIVTMGATPPVSAVTLKAVQGMGSVINGATLWKFDVEQSGAAQPTFLETVTASEAWATSQGSNWNLSVTRNGANAPELRLMVQGDRRTYLPNTLGLAVGGGITPREMLDVSGAIILTAATAATPANGTLHYTGTKFQGRVGGAWVDIPGPAPAPILWADDVTTDMLSPTGTNKGVALPSAGNGLIIRHSTYPTIDRRTGVDADDNSLLLHAGSSGIQFKTWDSSALLGLLDATGQLTIAGVTHKFGTYGELYTGQYYTDLFANGPGAAGYDRNGNPTWCLRLQHQTGFDAVRFQRRPANSDTFTDMCLVDPNGNLTIVGGTATKASGTTWANPSDPRLKDDVSPYARGLADVLALEPISYRLKAQPDGPLCYGFDASQVRTVFPECVSETRMKLAPDDAEETDGVLVFDMHPILVAIVNAIKELAGK